MLLSAESTPTRFISVKGLSSPFRDQPATSLTVSSHVIDISPSPPPPASLLANLSGRFEDALSPDVKTPTESELNPMLDIDEFAISEPTTLNARHQPIGLGLGIDTGESTFANFLPMSAEALHSTPTLPWGIEQSAPSSSPLVTLSTRRVQLSPWPTSFDNLTPERSENHDSWTEAVLHGQELETAEHRPRATLKRETNPSPEISPSLSIKSPVHVSSVTPQTNTLKTENVPSISQRLTRRLLSFNRKSLAGDDFKSEKVAPELQVIPELVISPIPDSSSGPMPLSMKFSPRGRLLSTLRHRMKLRGIDNPDSAQVTRASPVLPTRGGSDAGSFIAPSQDAYSSGKNDSPLELPSSPAFPSHSPNLRDAPGSFSPLMYDNKAFSPAMSHAPQAHVMPVHPGATTLVVSIVAGSLGLVGICLILIILAWKKNGCFPGLSSWKRKHRGTAYDEFMEEKSCWIADKKLKIHRESKPNPERTVTAVNQKSNSFCSASEDVRSGHPVSRSPSQAPSIPPLAYLVNGKLSIDSIRLEFPAPVSSPMAPSLSSGLSSNYEDDLKQNDYKVISTLKNRTQPEPAQSPHKIDFSDDAHLASRPRSDSKSSTISKASLKSISSIASFLLSITKFDSLSAGNKKGKLEMGISSENYKNVRESLNSVNDPFSMSSPKYAKKPSIPAFNQPIKRVDSADGLVRAASAQLNRLNYSVGSQDAPKRPNTISCVPPAILITDHPSELIPPSPPRSSTYDQRPESIGTFLARYSNFNCTTEQGPHPEESDSYMSPQHQYSTSQSIQIPHDNRAVFDLPVSKVKVSSEVERADRQPTPRIRTLSSGQEWRARDPRINSVSSLISHRSRTSELLGTAALQDFDRSNVKFDFAPKRTSLNTLNSSQTIRELAAVTEDLRALIDSEMDPDCSWDLPSQFHQTVPDWVTLPAKFMVAPPMRPPKSASRYSSMKPTAIEYESTSTPCSPNDPNPLSSRRVSSHSSWESAAIQYPDTNFNPSSSAKGKRVSTGSRVKKSNSESSIETVVSAESNASILEIASLHTAQTQSVRGVSAEFVIRQSIAQIQALEAHNRLRMALGTRPE
ncbi:hypothetical protein PtA15_1A53 [Puccinia triticina]|uniref:Uncharacterized protein n=1 Tax=Puccinia triticina TaxID=208348 RepID=A0ABY7C7E5_9BASI|nr:uncharacterized protein PtA15_1A53 [Puccinia triticina]WAQ80715.1 hypothetical protein PtA15_1A53 [Puccinia triticina]WAR51607.1 hypothetical protein PtB15_1B43 [Puccinia triticina]